MLAAERIAVAPLVGAVRPLEGITGAVDAARRELKMLLSMET
jgi:hypothetical protein